MPLSALALGALLLTSEGNFMSHTGDLSDAFFPGLISVAEAVEASPTDILCVMMNESGVYAKAHNPHGDASGLIQFMPATLRGLGWQSGDASFRLLSAEAQLPYVQRYFAPHKGRLVDLGSVYTAVFLPALLPSIKGPDTVLCALGGQLSWAYKANTGFDPNHTGVITVGMLGEAVSRACKGPRWDELASRMREAEGLQPTQPAPPDDTQPLPVSEDPSVNVGEALVFLGYVTLIDFQEAMGLPATGECDALTHRAIADAVQEKQDA